MSGSSYLELPSKSNLKKKPDYTKFKEFIKDWFGMKFKCNLCSFWRRHMSINFMLSIRPGIWPVL